MGHVNLTVKQLRHAATAIPPPPYRHRRAAALDGSGGVWYATCDRVATHWRATHAFDPADARINPFIEL